MAQTDTLTFPTLGSPPRFSFPDLQMHHDHDFSIASPSELSSTTSTPFVSAPSSPRFHGFYYSAPTSPCSWAHSMAAAQSFDHYEAGCQRTTCPESPGQNMPRNGTLFDVETAATTSRDPRTQLQINGENESRAEGARAELPSRTSRSRQLVNTHTLKRLHVDAADAADSSYSWKSFYASAVPFAWEERPGTPKARSAATSSVADNSEEDSSSILLSGSSEFEFSARFSELEEPPMSPTPITGSFKHQNFAYSPRYDLAQKLDDQIETEHQQTWPLPPPPRLDNPVLPVRQLIRDEAHEESKCSHRSMSSLSAPQSPRSPHKFDLRGALCGIFSPADAVFDPFVAAMEKMAANSENYDKMHLQGLKEKNTVKLSHGHHRRTQSSSPLRGFHWDDRSAKSNSSSNECCVDEVKVKHPIQREIIARHSSCTGTPKGSKRWSFKGFLHRKSQTSEHMALQPNSLRSSGRSSGRDSSCSSASAGEVPIFSDVDDNTKMRQCINSPGSNMLSMSTTPSSPLSSSSSGNSRSGKIPANTPKTVKAPYALHYTMQRASTEELRKKTFLPYKQGLLGCLGLSSKSYRALTTLSKPFQQTVS